METKYLSDGRKVVVIGQLNNVESIVQEIFITDQGDEIPSGEKFTTKSLHDTPVKSYAEKQAEKWKIQESKSRLDLDKINANKHLASEELKGLRSLIKAHKKTIETFNNNPEDLEVLLKAISGSIEWIVEDSYYIQPPVKYEDLFTCYENRHGDRYFDSIRLLSVAGCSDGSLEYWRGKYSDGSGGHTKIELFESYEEACDFVFSKIMKKLEDGKDCFGDYERLTKKDFKLPKNIEQIILNSELDKKESYLSLSKEKYEDDLERISKDIECIREKCEGN